MSANSDYVLLALKNGTLVVVLASLIIQLSDAQQPIKAPIASTAAKSVISEAQQRLVFLGYELGSANGVVTPSTIMALRKFQSQHVGDDGNTLPVTGILDEKTLAVLLPGFKDQKLADDVAKQFPDMAKQFREKNRDVRFIAYENGTVLDTKTDILWAAKDNGKPITWDDAKFYCEKYRAGGFADWRMPVMEELAQLYDETKTHTIDATVGVVPSTSGKAKLVRGYFTHVATELIDITSPDLWTAGADSVFRFGFGKTILVAEHTSGDFRILPVRSDKPEGKH